VALACVAVLGASLAAAASARAAAELYIRGGGEGHGIGMSQYGAYGYALHGYDYRSILAHYYTGTAIGFINPERTVRVLLSTGSASFSGATSAGDLALQEGATYTVQATADGSLRLLDAGGHSLGTLRAPVTASGSGPLTVPGHGRYRGQLQLRPDGQGGVETVNAVALDDYVRGVVAAEMPAGWAAQALEAQAVAARTYAITTTVGAAGYDLYDDTRSQMYGGVGAETPATDAAVAATSGQIATYDGRPAVTYFFSSSGGYTEDVENVWPGASAEPWLRGVPDPYDNAGGDPYHRWGSQMSLAAAASKLARLVPGRLMGIAVTRHGVSPRILQASVVGSRGAVAVTGDQLQSALGLATTYATFTTISTTVSVRRLSVSVYPAPRRGSVLVQVQAGGRWQTLAHAPLNAAGCTRGQLPGPGRYRVWYRRLGGPAVSAR
jgi:stage II sporulation protein D